MLPLQTGDRVAEDFIMPSIIALQYHGTGVLASNKKTVLHIVSFNFNLLIELLDKIKMKNYPTW